MHATDKQISYLNSLIKGRFSNLGEAMVEYGLHMQSPANLSKYDASGMIEWLTAPVKTAEQIAAEDAALAERAAAAAEAKAAHDAQVAADRAAADDLKARVDALMEERGLAHLTGQARRDARYEINKELKGA